MWVMCVIYIAVILLATMVVFRIAVIHAVTFCLQPSHLIYHPHERIEYELKLTFRGFTGPLPLVVYHVVGRYISTTVLL